MGKLLKVRPGDNSEVTLTQSLSEIEPNETDELEIKVPKAQLRLTIDGGEVLNDVRT